MIGRLAVAGAISVYQMYISPHKGYCCAHKALHHRGSCSEFGKKVVLRFGIVRFFQLMPLRFKKCRDAYGILQSQVIHETENDSSDEAKDCPITPKDPFTKECGYCGFTPCHCAPLPF